MNINTAPVYHHTEEELRGLLDAVAPQPFYKVCSNSAYTVDFYESDNLVVISLHPAEEEKLKYAVALLSCMNALESARAALPGKEVSMVALHCLPTFVEIGDERPMTAYELNRTIITQCVPKGNFIIPMTHDMHPLLRSDAETVVDGIPLRIFNDKAKELPDAYLADGCIILNGRYDDSPLYRLALLHHEMQHIKKGLTGRCSYQQEREIWLAAFKTLRLHGVSLPYSVVKRCMLNLRTYQ